jgi:hypothetical protein
LAPELRLGAVYDIESGFGLSNLNLSIDGPNVSSWEIEKIRHRTWVSTAIGQGLPGRDGTGPLLYMVAKGFRGQSGSAVTLAAEDATSSSLTGNEWVRAKGAKNLLLGMVLAVEPSGLQTAALPAPTIYKILAKRLASESAIEDPDPLHDRHSLSQGTLIPAINAVMLRGSLVPSGTGTLNDGGTGTLNDGGTGTLNDGGTGTLNDGSALRSSPHSTQPLSGLRIGDKTWLSLNPNWIEHEALSEEVITAIKAQGPQGIYDEKGHLYASDASALAPEWLPKISIASDSDPSQFLDHSMMERDYLSNHYNIGMPCAWTSGALKDEKQFIRMVNVAMCEEATGPQSRRVYVSFLPVKSSDPSWTFAAEIAPKNGVCTSYPCELSLLAGLAHTSPGLPSDPTRESHYLRFVRFYQSFKFPSEESLTPTGLHDFSNANFAALLTREGGFRFEFKHQGKSFVLRGPTTAFLIEGASPLSFLLWRKELQIQP